MNILGHCISQVPHRKQMAYTNSDYLRRLLLTAVLFSKAWAEWRETKQGVQQPQISNSMAVTMPRPKGAGGGEQQLWVPRKKGATWRGGSVTSSPHKTARTKKCVGCTQLPNSNLPPKLSISKIQRKIQGRRNHEHHSVFISFLGKEQMDMADRRTAPPKTPTS